MQVYGGKLKSKNLKTLLLQYELGSYECCIVILKKVSSLSMITLTFRVMDEKKTKKIEGVIVDNVFRY